MADEDTQIYYSKVYVDVAYNDENEKEKNKQTQSKVDVDNQADISNIDNALKTAKPGAKLVIKADSDEVVKEANASIKEANKSGNINGVQPSVEFSDTDVLKKVNESIGRVNESGKVHSINGSVYFDPDKVALALQNALAQTGVDKQPNTKSEAVDVDKTKTENEIKDLTEKTPITITPVAKQKETKRQFGTGIKGKEKAFNNDIDYAKFMSTDRHDFFIKIDGKLLTDEVAKTLSSTTRKLWDNYKSQLKGASTSPKNLKKPVNPELDKNFSTYSKKDQEALIKSYESDLAYYEDEMDILTNKSRVQEKESKYPRAVSIPAINLTFQRLLEGLAEDENVVSMSSTSTTKEVDGKSIRIYRPDVGVKKTAKFREDELKRKGTYVPDYHDTSLSADNWNISKKGGNSDALMEGKLEIFKLRQASVNSPKDSASLEITNIISSLLLSENNKARIAEILFDKKKGISKLFQSKGIDYDFSYWENEVFSNMDEQDIDKYKDSISESLESYRLRKQRELDEFNKRWNITSRPKPAFSYVPNITPHEKDLIEKYKLYQSHPEDTQNTNYVAEHIDELELALKKEDFIKSINGGMDEVSSKLFEDIKVNVRKRLIGSIESLSDVEKFPEYGLKGSEFSKGNKLKTYLNATIDSLINSVLSPKGFFDRISVGNSEFEFTGPFQVPNIFNYVFKPSGSELSEDTMKGVADETEDIVINLTRMLYNAMANQGRNRDALKKIFDVGILPELNISGISNLEELKPSYLVEVEKEKKELSAKQKKMMSYETDELIQKYINEDNQWYFHYPKSKEDIDKQVKEHDKIVKDLKKKHSGEKKYKLPKKVTDWKPITTETLYVNNPAIAAMAEVAKVMRKTTDTDEYSKLQDDLNNLAKKAFAWDEDTKTFGLSTSKKTVGYNIAENMVNDILNYAISNNKIPLFVKSSFKTTKDLEGLRKLIEKFDVASSLDELLVIQEEVDAKITEMEKKGTDVKGYRDWRGERFKLAQLRLNRTATDVTEEEVLAGTMAGEYTSHRRTNLMKLDDRPIVPMNYKLPYNRNKNLQTLNESLRGLYDAYISGMNYKLDGTISETDFFNLAELIDEFTETFIDEEKALRNGKKDANGNPLKDHNFRKKQSALMSRKQSFLRILGPSGLGLNLDEIKAIRVKSLEKAFFTDPGETAQSVFKKIDKTSGYINPYRIINVKKSFEWKKENALSNDLAQEVAEFNHAYGWDEIENEKYEQYDDAKKKVEELNYNRKDGVAGIDYFIKEMQKEVYEYNKAYWEHYKTYTGNESKPRPRGIVEKRYGSNVKKTGYYLSKASEKFSFGEFVSQRAHFKRMDKLNEAIKKLEMSVGLVQETWVGENGQLMFGESSTKMTKELMERYGSPDATNAVLDAVVASILKNNPKYEAKNFQSIMDMLTAYNNYGAGREYSPLNTALTRIAHQSSLGKEFFENFETFSKLRKGEIQADKIKFYEDSPNEKVYVKDENGKLIKDGDDYVVDTTEYTHFLKKNLYDIFSEWSILYPETEAESEITKRQLEFDRLLAISRGKNPRIRLREPNKDEFDFANTIVSRNWPFDIRGNLSSKKGVYINQYAGDKGLSSIKQIRKSLQNSDVRKQVYAYIQKYHRQFVVGETQKGFKPTGGKELFVKTLANLMFFKEEDGTLLPNRIARESLRNIFRDTYGKGETGKLPEDLLTQLIDISYHKITGEVPESAKEEFGKHRLAKFLEEYSNIDDRLLLLSDPSSDYSTEYFRNLFKKAYPEIELPPVKLPELSQEEIDRIIAQDIGEENTKKFNERKRKIYPFDVRYGAKKGPTKGGRSKKGKKRGKVADKHHPNKYLDFNYLFGTDEKNLGYFIKAKKNYPESIDALYTHFENWHKTYVGGVPVEDFSPDSGKGLLAKTLVNWFTAKPEQFSKLFNSIFGDERGVKVATYISDISAKAQNEYVSQNLPKAFSKTLFEHHPEYHMPFDDTIDDGDKARIINGEIDTSDWYEMPGAGMFGSGFNIEEMVKENQNNYNIRDRYLQPFYEKLLTLASAGMSDDKAFKYLRGYLAVLEDSELPNKKAELSFNAIYEKLYAKSKSGSYNNIKDKPNINFEKYKESLEKVNDLIGTEYHDEAYNYLSMMEGVYDRDLGGLITSVWRRNAKSKARQSNNQPISAKILSAQQAYSDVENIVQMMAGSGTKYEKEATALFNLMNGKYSGAYGKRIKELGQQFVTWKINQSNVPIQTPVTLTKTQINNQKKYNDAQNWVNQMIGTNYESEAKRWFGYMNGQYNSGIFNNLNKVYLDYLKSLGPQKPQKPPKQPSQRQIDIQNKMIQAQNMRNAMVGSVFQSEADATFNMMGGVYNHDLFSKLSSTFNKFTGAIKNFSTETTMLKDIENKYGGGSKKYQKIKAYYDEMIRLNDKSGPDSKNFDILYNKHMGKKVGEDKSPISSIFSNLVGGFVMGVINKIESTIMGIGSKIMSIFGDVVKKTLMFPVNSFKKSVALFTSSVKKALGKSQAYSGLSELMMTPLVLAVEYTMIPALKKLIPAIKEVINWTTASKDKFTLMGKYIGVTVNKVYDMLTGNFVLSFEKIFAVFNKYSNWIDTEFSNSDDTFFSKLSTDFSTLSQNIGSISTAVTTANNELVAYSKGEGFGAVANGIITNIIDSIGESLRTSIKTFIGIADNDAFNLKEIIVKVFENIIDAGVFSTELVSKLLTQLTNSITEILSNDKYQTLLSNIESNLVTVMQKVMDIVRNIVTQSWFASGVKDIVTETFPIWGQMLALSGIVGAGSAAAGKGLGAIFTKIGGILTGGSAAATVGAGAGAAASTTAGTAAGTAGATGAASTAATTAATSSASLAASVAGGIGTAVALALLKYDAVANNKDDTAINVIGSNFGGWYRKYSTKNFNELKSAINDNDLESAMEIMNSFIPIMTKGDDVLSGMDKTLSTGFFGLESLGYNLLSSMGDVSKSLIGYNPFEELISYFTTGDFTNDLYGKLNPDTDSEESTAIYHDGSDGLPTWEDLATEYAKKYLENPNQTLILPEGLSYNKLMEKVNELTNPNYGVDQVFESKKFSLDEREKILDEILAQNYGANWVAVEKYAEKMGHLASYYSSFLTEGNAEKLLTQRAAETGYKSWLETIDLNPSVPEKTYTNPINLGSGYGADSDVIKLIQDIKDGQNVNLGINELQYLVSHSSGDYNKLMRGIVSDFDTQLSRYESINLNSLSVDLKNLLYRYNLTDLSELINPTKSLPDSPTIESFSPSISIYMDKDNKVTDSTVKYDNGLGTIRALNISGGI